MKVTYFPDGFMKLKRQQLGLRPELTELKSFARRNNIPFDRNAKNNEQFQELLTRITELRVKNHKILWKNFTEFEEK